MRRREGAVRRCLSQASSNSNNIVVLGHADLMELICGYLLLDGGSVS